jgi:hypothetical protein
MCENLLKQLIDEKNWPHLVFVFHVNKLVLLQLTSPDEGLLAQDTRVGLLPCVDQLVSLQARSLREGLLTQVTHVWLFTGVD